MIQNVAGGFGPLPRIAAQTNTQGAGDTKEQLADRDDLRFNGAQGRGFAFGRTRQVAVPVQEPDYDDAASTSAGAASTASSEGSSASTPVETASGASTSEASTSGTAANTQATSTGGDGTQAASYGADTNAVVVNKDGSSFNINITITEGGGKGGKGTVQFEEGGNYSFSLSDHPGAKYAIVGLEGGNGITNPHNLKGTIFLDTATQQNTALVNKLDEFLSKRDEIASKVNEKPEKAEKAGKITLDDLEQFNLVAAPDVGILNIHDDRFDKSKFTNKEVLSLKVAAKISTQDPLNPVQENEDDKRGKGLKLGHQKSGFASYGNGLKLGHENAPGLLAYYA